jgi:hypothetical protein
LPAERRVSARRGWVGEKSGLFEHPANKHFLLGPTCRSLEFSCATGFSRSLFLFIELLIARCYNALP